MTRELAKIKKKLIDIPAATIYEANGKIGDMAPIIRQMVPGKKICGQAITVRCFPSDMTAVLRALNLAMPGDIIVIDGGGTDRSTVWGGTSTRAAINVGIGGVVTNSGCRDIDEIIELGFPVYATGTCVRGTVKNHLGWVNIPISVGGICVNPGDLVVGDRDGIVVVAENQIAKTAESIIKQISLEQDKIERVESGEKLTEIFGIKN